MQHSVLRGVTVAAFGALLMWNCGSGGGSATSAAPTAPTPTTSTGTGPATVTVAIVSSTGNTSFVPNPVKANSGDTVMFRNNDVVAHRIVMDDGSADLGDVLPGSTSRGFTLRSATATNFHCTLHGSMVGSINGLTAPEPNCQPDIYGYGC